MNLFISTSGITPIAKRYAGLLTKAQDRLKELNTKLRESEKRLRDAKAADASPSKIKALTSSGTATKKRIKDQYKKVTRAKAQLATAKKIDALRKERDNAAKKRVALHSKLSGLEGAKREALQKQVDAAYEDFKRLKEQEKKLVASMKK